MLDSSYVKDKLRQLLGVPCRVLPLNSLVVLAYFAVLRWILPGWTLIPTGCVLLLCLKNPQSVIRIAKHSASAVSLWYRSSTCATEIQGAVTIPAGPAEATGPNSQYNCCALAEVGHTLDSFLRLSVLQVLTFAALEEIAVRDLLHRGLLDLLPSDPWTAACVSQAVFLG
jgi:hypothetical protein